MDDHTIVRSALKAQCQDVFQDAIVDESADGVGVLAMLAAEQYDLVIMDIQIPDFDMLSVIAIMTESFPVVPVLVYSMTSSNIYALRAMRAGAKGFVSKVAPIPELDFAISELLAGKKYLNQELVDLVTDKSFIISGNPFSLLSGREIQVASLLLSGHTITEIARMLGLGLSTVGTHKGNLFSKLKVSNLLELKKTSDLYRFF